MTLDQNQELQNLRESILKLGDQYFELLHANQNFTPGKTYIPATAKVLQPDDLRSLLDSSLDLWLTAGRFTREFEHVFPKWCGRTSKALMVNSGSSANLLAFSSLFSATLSDFGMRPLQKDDEVITAAAGFPTTVNPILQNQCIPVFVDIDSKTLNVTTATIKNALSPKTKAIMLAHTLGNPYRSDELAQLCKERGIFLVEDCCDALGSQIDGKGPVGSFGQYATFSFYPAHHMTTGEGGAVVSAPGPFKKIAESMRDWGRDCWCEPGKDNTCGRRFDWTFDNLPAGYDHKYVYSHIGYNLKATDMQAALGLTQLKKLPGFMERRRENWRKLKKGFEDSPHLQRRFEPVQPTPGTSPSWFAFPVHCREGIHRETLVRFLEEKRIGTRPVFGGNLLKQPAYSRAVFRVHGDLKNTESVMKQTFWLGVHPAMGDAQIEYILDQLESFSKEH